MTAERDLDINAIEARALAATPNVQAWVRAAYPNAWTTQTSDGVPVALYYGKNPKADAELAAKARETTLALVARVRGLEAKLNALVPRVREIQEAVEGAEDREAHRSGK